MELLLPIGLRLFSPAPALSAYVTLLYKFDIDQTEFSDIERAGHAQLRFAVRGSRLRYAFVDGTGQGVGPIQLVGPTTGATLAGARGPVEVVGCELTPVGWAGLVGVAASSLANRVIDPTDRFPGLAQLSEELARTSDLEAQIAALEAWLSATIVPPRAGTIEFVRKVDAWLAASPSPQLEDLEAAAGLSRRQVERRCNALYGAPPKVLARRCRALRTATALVVDGASVDDALARGFYDQSHMIREIKHFTGTTPRQLRTNPPPLASTTIRERAKLPDGVGKLIRET